MRFIVSGDSMKPSFTDGDKLLVSRFFYKLKKPQIGDVVVLRDPRTNRLLLKRVMRIKDGNYFVEGDNAEKSTDSRKFGFVDKKLILGKVIEAN